MVPELIEIRKQFFVLKIEKGTDKNNTDRRLASTIVMVWSSKYSHHLSVCLSVWSSWCLYHHCVVTIARWSGCNSHLVPSSFVAIIIKKISWCDYQLGAINTVLSSPWCDHHITVIIMVRSPWCDHHSIIITMVQRSSTCHKHLAQRILILMIKISILCAKESYLVGHRLLSIFKVPMPVSKSHLEK